MSPVRPQRAAVPGSEERAARWRFARMLALDLVLPLVLYYALRAGGVSPWTALVAGGAIPLLRVVVAATRRRLEAPGAFTVSLLAIGTAVGLLTADPRLLLARESYLTGVVGVWILATLRARRPLVYQATIGFMPTEAAAAWRRAWRASREFRRAMRGMTLAFGLAFVTDAAARTVMAYTLPLDLVPVLSVLLLVLLLVAVVQVGKAYGRRRLSDVLAEAPTHQLQESDGSAAGRRST